MTESNCKCNMCQSACKDKPGWFKPGEAEQVAELLALSMPDFFSKYLLVDYFTGELDIFLLSPSVVGADAGEEFPANPRGQCVFYKDGKCSIYSARPFECREYFHEQSHDEISERHEAVAEAWSDHQDQIKELLGREPISQSWSIFDEMGFSSLFNDW